MQQRLEFWLLGDLYRYQGFFFRAELVPEGDGRAGALTLRPASPLAMMSTLQLYARLHPLAKKMGTLPVLMRPVDWGNECGRMEGRVLEEAASSVPLAITSAAPKPGPKRTGLLALEDGPWAAYLTLAYPPPEPAGDVSGGEGQRGLT